MLLVDDDLETLSSIRDMLEADYRVRITSMGGRALQIATSEMKPDLILLDLSMPAPDGYEVLAQLRGNPETRDIPVILMKEPHDTEDEERGLAMGAVDYIAKPVHPQLLLARVRAHMELKYARFLLANRDVYIEVEIARRMGEVVKLVQEVSIQALMQLAETKHCPNSGHFLRIREYVRALAMRLQGNPRFPALSDQAIELLHKTVPLHDIGKIIVPDHILLKPGKLTPQEWAIIKSHTEMGAEVIEQVGRHEHGSGQLLVLAREIVLHHHERWDGSGYPQGLSGNDIPVAARLTALADAFDALISRRSYRSAASFEEARSIIAQGRGRQFDPDIVDAFLAIFDEFKLIAQRHADAEVIPFPKVSSLPAASPWSEPMSHLRTEAVHSPRIEPIRPAPQPLETKIESLAEKLRAIEMELGSPKRPK